MLRPLGLADSFFPASRPERDAVTSRLIPNAIEQVNLLLRRSAA